VVMGKFIALFLLKTCSWESGVEMSLADQSDELSMSLNSEEDEGYSDSWEFGFNRTVLRSRLPGRRRQ